MTWFQSGLSSWIISFIFWNKVGYLSNFLRIAVELFYLIRKLAGSNKEILRNFRANFGLIFGRIKKNIAIFYKGYKREFWVIFLWNFKANFEENSVGIGTRGESETSLNTVVHENVKVYMNQYVNFFLKFPQIFSKTAFSIR